MSLITTISKLEEEKTNINPIYKLDTHTKKKSDCNIPSRTWILTATTKRIHKSPYASLSRPKE